MGPRNIKKDQAEKYYYAKDHFYDSDQSRWFGEGCRALGLEGNVKKDDFLNILDAKNKEGVPLTKIFNNRRAAIDFVFECPKSVSMVFRLHNDSRLCEIVENALDITLNRLEKEVIYTRVMRESLLAKEQTSKMIAAIFPHSTSRSCVNTDNKVEFPDMHEHRHVVIMNLTQIKSGKWLSLDNQPIFDKQRYFNSIFQSELSKQIKALGYEISLKSNGNWEVSGVKQEWIDIFSKRKYAIDERFQILKQSNKYPKMNDAQLRDIAANETRLDKDLNYSSEQLLTEWSKQLSPEHMKLSIENAKIAQYSTNNCLKEAYEALHTKESGFLRTDLATVMMQLSRGVWH